MELVDDEEVSMGADDEERGGFAPLSSPQKLWVTENSRLNAAAVLVLLVIVLFSSWEEGEGKGRELVGEVRSIERGERERAEEGEGWT